MPQVLNKALGTVDLKEPCQETDTYTKHPDQEQGVRGREEVEPSVRQGAVREGFTEEVTLEPSQAERLELTRQ